MIGWTCASTTNRIGWFGITFFTSASTTSDRASSRPFDDDDVIAHVGGKAVMRSAGDPEETVGDLLRRGGHRRGPRIPNLVRDGDVDEVFG